MSRVFVLKLKDKSTRDQVINVLSSEKSVLFAESQGDMQLFNNDLQYPDQWHLNNTGQTGGSSDADIDAPEVWSEYTGSSSVKLGIIDTGIETSHDDLSGKSSGDAPEDFPYDGYAHGTHVAGIAGAKHNNSGEVKGVDANVEILSRKVFSGSTYDPYTQTYHAKWAGNSVANSKITSAVNSGADVLNHSYGGSEFSTTLRMAFTYAYEHDVTSVVSMGNTGGSQIRYPAAFGQGIVAVGATDHNDLLATYSTTGNHIDLSAPGSAVLSTWRGNNYNTISGTSMAAPVVSGMATLLKGYSPGLYNDDIENILHLSADDKGATGWDSDFGHGRANMHNAFKLLKHPYETEYLTASGGSVYSSTGTSEVTWFGVDGLADGLYLAKRYEVRKQISFNYNPETHVWGRGNGSIGLSNVNPNFGMGFCDVVSHNSTSATLRTYVYQVWSIGGTYLGYYPAAPSSATFNYTLLKKTELYPPENLSHTWVGDNIVLTWDPSPDIEPADEYVIYKKGCGSSSYSIIGYTDGLVTTFTDNSETPVGNPGDKCYVYYKVKGVQFTSGDATPYSNITRVAVNDSEIIMIKRTVEGGIVELPTEFAVSPAYPNPFNPSTTVRYGLPEYSDISIKVVDLTGKVVWSSGGVTQSPGYHEFRWNGMDDYGKSVSSGIYLIAIESQNVRFTEKVMLIR